MSLKDVVMAMSKDISKLEIRLPVESQPEAGEHIFTLIFVVVPLLVEFNIKFRRNIQATRRG